MTDMEIFIVSFIVGFVAVLLWGMRHRIRRARRRAILRKKLRRLGRSIERFGEVVSAGSEDFKRLSEQLIGRLSEQVSQAERELNKIPRSTSEERSKHVKR